MKITKDPDKLNCLRQLFTIHLIHHGLT